MTTPSNPKPQHRPQDVIHTGDVSRHVEVDADELSESRRVVVLDGFGVSKCLHDWIRLQQLRLQLALTDKKKTKTKEIKRGRKGFRARKSIRIVITQNELHSCLRPIPWKNGHDGGGGRGERKDENNAKRKKRVRGQEQGRKRKVRGISE